MKTVTSVSGGQSSAYIAANYPSDFLVFALVCIEDHRCTPKDKKLVQLVSDRIGRDFIATAEDDIILHTMLDLEQYLGQRIDWVVGPTFDELTSGKFGKVLPSVLRRFCTAHMKMQPMFEWWQDKIGEPVKMQIGFRAGEERRANSHFEKCNDDGLLEQAHVVGKHTNGNNKWAQTPWQKPCFPLIENGIHRDNVVEFWKGKPVRFAKRNNCVGCFHRNPILLRQQFDEHPEKMEWFARQERNRKYPNDTWLKTSLTYDVIKKHRLQTEIDFEDWSDCDSGYCGL
tara:strand:- start:7612 stop:8466 length:855 start_codon:yes stop_codon:yes gene_type:complete